MRVQVRVLLVDDQAPFRRAARRAIDFTEGFRVVGEAATGEESLVAVRELRPDLVVMDLRLPGIDGLEATRRILGEFKETVVLIVSAYGAEELAGYEGRLERSGAAGYVPKSEFGPGRLTSTWLSASTTRS